MTEKTGTQKIIAAGARWCLPALLAIVLTAAPILAAQADGATQCPLPRKGSSNVKQTRPNAAPRGILPAIDLAVPVKTETAIFAMG